MPKTPGRTDQPANLVPGQPPTAKHMIQILEHVRMLRDYLHQIMLNTRRSERGAEQWDVVTGLAIAAPEGPAIRHNPFRRDVRIINTGTVNPIYVAPRKAQGVTNAYPILPGLNIQLLTTGDVWIWAPAGSTYATVETYDRNLDDRGQ